jgi:hypothetical protein
MFGTDRNSTSPLTLSAGYLQGKAERHVNLRSYFVPFPATCVDGPILTLEDEAGLNCAVVQSSLLLCTQCVEIGERGLTSVLDWVDLKGHNDSKLWRRREIVELASLEER